MTKRDDDTGFRLSIIGHVEVDGKERCGAFLSGSDDDVRGVSHLFGESVLISPMPPVTPMPADAAMESSMTKRDDIDGVLPCPFCGQHPISFAPSVCESWTVECSNEECNINPAVDDIYGDGAMGKAVSAWNRRTSMPVDASTADGMTDTTHTPEASAGLAKRMAGGAVFYDDCGALLMQEAAAMIRSQAAEIVRLTPTPWVSEPGSLDVAELFGAVNIAGVPYLPMGRALDMLSARDAEIAGAKIALEQAWESNRERIAEIARMRGARDGWEDVLQAIVWSLPIWGIIPADEAHGALADALKQKIASGAAAEAQVAALTADRDSIAAVTVEMCAAICDATAKKRAEQIKAGRAVPAHSVDVMQQTRWGAGEVQAKFLAEAIRALSPIPPHVGAARVLWRSADFQHMLIKHGAGLDEAVAALRETWAGPDAIADTTP